MNFDEVVTSFDDAAAEGCPPHRPELTEPLTDRFVVLAGVRGLEPALGVLSTERVVQMHSTLGILEFEGTTQEARALAAALGDDGIVAPSLPINHAAEVAVRGIDWLVSNAIAQASGADGAYGGRVVGADLVAPRVIVHPDGRWELAASADDIPVPPALLPVINLSFGPRSPHYPFMPNDIMNLATFAASRHVVPVVAAGNCGRLGAGTISAWAQPTWVLSVGASHDEEGMVVSEYSGRGSPHVAGPDVIAWGRSEVPPHPLGTSFAAPRVAGLVSFLVGAMCQLGRAFRVAFGAPDHGVPRIGHGFVDRFADEIWDTTREILDTAGLPVVGVSTDAVAAAASSLTAAGVRFEVAVTPALASKLLVQCARAMPGNDPSISGFGFVNEDLVIERLSSISALGLITIFDAAAGLDPELVAKLAAIRVFDRTGLVVLLDVIRTTAPSWRFDRASGRIARVPLDPAAAATLDPVSRKQGLLPD